MAFLVMANTEITGFCMSYYKRHSHGHYSMLIQHMHKKILSHPAATPPPPQNLQTTHLQVLRDKEAVLVFLVVAVHDHHGGAGVSEAGQALQYLSLIPHLCKHMIMIEELGCRRLDRHSSTSASSRTYVST